MHPLPDPRCHRQGYQLGGRLLMVPAIIASAVCMLLAVWFVADDIRRGDYTFTAFLLIAGGMLVVFPPF